MSLLLLESLLLLTSPLLLPSLYTVVRVHNVAGVPVAVVLDIPIISAAVVDTRCIHVFPPAADVPRVFAVVFVTVVAGSLNFDPL